MTISVKLWDRLTYKHNPRDIMEARKVLDMVDGDIATHVVNVVQDAMDNGANSEQWNTFERMARMLNVKTVELVSFWFIMTDYDVWED